MKSTYFNPLSDPKSLFHPEVVSEEDVYAIKTLYTPAQPIKPSKEFSKEEMSKVPSMAWMKDKRFVLVAPNRPEETYGTEIEVVSSPLEWFKSVEHRCHKFPWLKKDQKLVAFDLESTGLNTNFRIHGGQMTRFETMVGLCLSVDEEVGYYLPIFHTEEDEVKNWNWDLIVELLNHITNQDEYILTLHNAQYDFSLMRSHGLKIPTICNDTLVLSKLMNNYEFFPYHIKDGLKILSEFVLGRKMIEIHEFFGSKNQVQFNLLPATAATVYGGSDAINSLSLYHEFVTRDKFGRNQWEVANLNCKIVHSYIYAIVSQSQQGIPIDYKHAMSTLRTTIRRAILLERRWAEIMERNKVEYKITSNEQANMFVGNLLRSHYFGDPTTFDTWATETFGTTIKHVTVGKDANQRVKTTYGMDDNVITAITKNIDRFDYPDGIKQEIKDVLEIVSIYRSLTHDIPMYIGLIRCAFRDDRGIVYGNASTRMEGTDTGRNASSKASGPMRAYVTYGKLKTKVEVQTKADGNILSVNSQGMPATSFYLKDSKKLTKVPEHLKQQYDQLSQEVESRIKLLLKDA